MQFMTMMQATTARQQRRRWGVLARQEERAAYLFLLPWLIGLVVFLLGPIIASVVHQLDRLEHHHRATLGRAGELRKRCSSTATSGSRSV